MRCAVIVIAFGLWAAAGASLAEDNKTGDDARPATLELSAQEIESPLLKRRLYPVEPELVEGDAAPILLRLPWEQTRFFSEEIHKLERWLTLPLDHPDWQDSNGVLPANFYREMKRAAYRRDAHWGYPLHEEPLYNILLPDLQGARGVVGYGLSAKIRYHIRNGEFDQAREGIAVGLGVSRHYAKTPFIVTQLVVAALQRMMLDRTLELMAADGSPNLYWALSSLPRPLFDLRPSLEFEVRALDMTIPELANLDHPRDADEWREIGLRLAQTVDVQVLSGEIPPDALEQRRQMWVDLARKELTPLTGAEAKVVAAMSDDEAAIRWFLWHHRSHVDRAAAAQSLPPREAFGQLMALERDLEEFSKLSWVSSGAIFNPFNVYAAVWAPQRRVDALRVIEAVRHHAATHGGKLPESLDDIKDVPVPVDPLTGQPFTWKVVDGLGELASPSIPGVDRPSLLFIQHQVRIR